MRSILFRDPCRAVVAAVDAGRVTATTTIEVIQEFCHVRAHRLIGPMPPSWPAATPISSRRSSWSITTTSAAGSTCSSAWTASARSTHSSRDRAAARRGALVSADVAFAQVVDPCHLDPAAPDFAEKLARLD